MEKRGDWSFNPVVTEKAPIRSAGSPLGLFKGPRQIPISPVAVRGEVEAQPSGSSPTVITFPPRPPNGFRASPQRLPCAFPPAAIERSPLALVSQDRCRSWRCTCYTLLWPCRRISAQLRIPNSPRLVTNAGEPEILSCAMPESVPHADSRPSPLLEGTRTWSGLDWDLTCDGISVPVWTAPKRAAAFSGSVALFAANRNLYPPTTGGEWRASGSRGLSYNSSSALLSGQ